MWFIVVNSLFQRNKKNKARVLTHLFCVIDACIASREDSDEIESDVEANLLGHIHYSSDLSKTLGMQNGAKTDTNVRKLHGASTHGQRKKQEKSGGVVHRHAHSRKEFT